MSYTVQVPFKVFGDIDGKPLEAGSIYIGSPGLDPIANPINVYFDQELTIPASQPISTINGYPSNNGTPANLFVDSEDYSITVQNKKGTLVYSSTSVVSSFSTGGINIKDFGATGDGSTDDTAAIAAALATVTNVSGGRSFFFPRGTYQITSLTLNSQFGIHIYGEANNVFSTIRVTGTISCTNVGAFKCENLCFVGEGYNTDTHVKSSPTVGNYLFTMEGCADWNIVDCQFESFDRVFSADNVTSYVINITGCYFNWSNCDIYLNAALHWDIMSNIFSETRVHNLRWLSGQEIRYTGNKHENTTNAMTGAHINVDNNPSIIDATSVITENTFHQFYGFYFRGVRQLTVANNAIRLAEASDSITFDGCDEVVCEGNQLYGFNGTTYQNNGIAVLNAGGVHLITNNIIRDYANCLLLQGNSQALNIQSNNLIGQTSSITVYTTTGVDQIVTVDQNVIQNNIISGDGAALNNSSEWLLRNNTIISGSITNNDSLAIQWYQEGTWTPVDDSGAALSLTVNEARYIKNGDMITASFNITYPATADGTQAKIGGLPFNCAAESVHHGFLGLSQAAKDFGLLVEGGTDDIVMSELPGGANINNSDLSSSVIRGTVIYKRG